MSNKFNVVRNSANGDYTQKRITKLCKQIIKDYNSFLRRRIN
jgi:hypothetical protein